MTDDRLDLAVERGIITTAQRDEIRALGDRPATGPRREAREGFNPVTIAYAVGGAIVLFGFGWFIVDRWSALGPGGVLLVGLLYATLFILVAAWLERHEYPLAAALATVLAVGMAPLITWAVLELAGLWPAGEPYCRRGLFFLWECTGKWITLDLVTMLAALAALRRSPHPLLVHPIAVALGFLLVHLITIAGTYGFLRYSQGWLAILGASLFAWLAYSVDRRFGHSRDYALWLWALAIVTAIAGMMLIWDFERPLRHLWPLIAIGAFGVAVVMRRRLLLVLGGVAILWYMVYLVERFRDAVALPVLLATMGLVIILGAVGAQRAWPRLVRRVDESELGARRLPGGPLALLAPGVLALLVLAGPARARDVELNLQRVHERRVWQARQRREAREAWRRDSVLAARGDTMAAQRLERRRRGVPPARNPD